VKKSICRATANVASQQHEYSTASSPDGTFRAADMQITLAKPQQLQQKPDVATLQFGKQFTDYMLTVEWDKPTGWSRPKISPLQPLKIHPAAKVLHYAIEVTISSSS